VAQLQDVGFLASGAVVPIAILDSGLHAVADYETGAGLRSCQTMAVDSGQRISQLRNSQTGDSELTPF